MKRLAILSLSLTLAAPLTWGASTECTRGALTRSVEVVYASPPAQTPCEVVYTKPDEGATRTSLWNAQTESGYCEARAAEFVEKLQGLGWNCTGPAPDASAASGAGSAAESPESPAPAATNAEPTPDSTD